MTTWGLGVDKTQGPDGFSIFFYCKFWDIVKPDIIKLIECLHEGTLQLYRLNYAYVVLISNGRKEKEAGNFRPISVLNASREDHFQGVGQQAKDNLVDFIDDH